MNITHKSNFKGMSLIQNGAIFACALRKISSCNTSHMMKISLMCYLRNCLRYTMQLFYLDCKVGRSGRNTLWNLSSITCNILLKSMLIPAAAPRLMLSLVPALWHNLHEAVLITATMCRHLPMNFNRSVANKMMKSLVYSLKKKCKYCGKEHEMTREKCPASKIHLSSLKVKRSLL